MSQVISPPTKDTELGDGALAPNGASPALGRSQLRQRERDRRRSALPSAAPGLEPRSERLRRGRRRTALYVRAAAIVGLLAVLIALVATNTRSVELHWVVGSGEASLVWIIFFTGVVAWLLGIATSALFRRRTRRPATADDARAEEPAR